MVTKSRKFDSTLALVQACRNIDDLRQLDGLDLSQVAVELAVKKILADYGDDMFMLFAISVDFEGNEENKYWCVEICDAVFEKVMDQCKTLSTLIVLYKALPGRPDPGDHVDRHTLVVERMITLAGEDKRKLYVLFRHLQDEPKKAEKEPGGEFGNMVLGRLKKIKK